MDFEGVNVNAYGNGKYRYIALNCDEAKFCDIQTHIAVSGYTEEMRNWIESMIGFVFCADIIIIGLSIPVK